MKNVTDYIRMLLYEHDYVTVPNLGAFIANYHPSGLNEISGSLMPPQKRVAFNEVLKQDDGLLATYISRREGVSIEESKRRIFSFVTDVKDTLAVKREFVFDKIGSFSVNHERGLVFDPDRKNNFYSESYGFDSLFPRKESLVSGREIYDYGQKVYLEDTHENYSDRVGSTHKSNSAFTYTLYTLPVLLLLSGLFYILFSNVPSKKSALSSVIPIEYFTNSTDKIETKEVIKPTPQPLVIDKSEIEKPNFDEKPAINSSSITPTAPETKAKEVEKTIAKTEELKTRVIAPPTPKIEEKKKETVPAKTIIESKKRYVIVCGMFKNKDNVNKLTTLLENNGFSPRVVPNNDLLKVIAAEAIDMNEANKISDKLRKLTGDKGVIQKL